jgi:glycosyltransferase involved in cell wall biosynthesis
LTDNLTFLMTSSFFPPFHVGGDATHVEYLSNLLGQNGYKVNVLHSIDAYKIKRRDKISLKTKAQPNVATHAISSPIGVLEPLISYTIGKSPFTTKEFAKLVDKTRPDVVHHHNLSLLGYNLLQKRGQYKSIYTAHDYWLICQTNNLFKNKNEICRKKDCFHCSIRSKRIPQTWRQNPNFNKALNNIDLIISPSKYVASQLVDLDKKIVTIPNFVPAPPVQFEKIIKGPYFLFLGMLEKHKGILQLLDLFREAKDKLNLKLVIAGGGSLSTYIVDYIRRYSLNDSVIFMGFTDNKTKYSLYKHAKAVIIPSIWPENAPLVALEALSVGTPVIGSNQGGLPEILSKFDTQFVFNDWQELKNTLLSLSIEDKHIGINKETFDRYFSPRAYVNNYLRTIEAL